MIRRHVSHIGKWAAAILLLAALIYPQTIDSEKGLFWCLPAYGALAIGLLLAAATTGLDFRYSGFCLAVTLIFVGYLALRALFSPAAYFARPDLCCVLAALVVYGLTASVITSTMARLAVVLSLLVFGVLHVAVAVIQRGFAENWTLPAILQGIERTHRATGFFVSANHLAGSLEVLFVLALGIACWSRWQPWSKAIIGLVAGLFFFGVVLTDSRGGFYGATASLLVFAVLSLIALRAIGKGSVIKFGGVGLVVIAAAVVAGAFFMQKGEASSRKLFSIDESRLGLWNAAIDQWKLEPVIGTGSGTYLFYGRQFRDERMQMDPIDAHNDYLQLLCEYGVVGAAAFLLFFFAHCREGWRTFMDLGPKRGAVARILPFSNRLALNIGALCAIAAYVVHSFVDFNLHIPANALLVAFVFGMIANPGIEPKRGALPARWSFPVRFAFVAGAAILLIQCARLFPGEYYADRALTALQNENPSSAISYANRALRWEQQNPDVFFYLGRALIALGHDTNNLDVRAANYKAATAAFEEARRLVPLDGTYPLEIASIYDQVGLFREAEEMFAIARERDPNSINISRLYQAHLNAWNRSGGTR